MARPTRQERIRRALRADAANDRIVSRSVRDSSSSWRTDAASIAKRAVEGRGIRMAIRSMVGRLDAVLPETMDYVYLRGYREAVENAAEYTYESLSLQLAYDREIKQIFGGLPLTEAELAAVKTFHAAESRRVLAMAATELEKAVRKTVGTAVEKGLTKRDAIRAVKKTVVGADAAQPYRLETIFRTSANLSYSAGSWQANRNPSIQSVLWGFEYVTVGDGRVRSSHAEFNGTRLPKEDPKWGSINPPNGWNCRCSTIPVYKDEKEAETVEPRSGAFVDEGFRFNPGTVRT